MKKIFVRFGKIPKNERSRIYNNGDVIIGFEKGVSVYEGIIDKGKIKIILPCDGKTIIDNQKIYFKFDKGVGKEYKELIFFHELVHLLFYYTGTGEWDNEKEVHSFTSFLYQVLKDNNLLK